MRGSGTVYNESRIVLAAVDRQAAEADLSMNLQDHLVAVYETYWQLYQTRAVRLQKEKLLQRALVIQKHLEARQAVDTTQRQVLRARAAVASRRSEIVRADMAIPPATAGQFARTERAGAAGNAPGRTADGGSPGCFAASLC